MIRDDKKTYVIKDSRSDYYKIGNSVDLYGREKALYHEVPSIEILFTFDYMIELHLHYYIKTKGHKDGFADTNLTVKEWRAKSTVFAHDHIIKSNPTLHLNLRRKWFDMIDADIKKEEYREIKPFFTRTFTDKGVKIKGKYYRPEDVIICISRGHAKGRDQMYFRLERIAKREGKEEWGAVPGVVYFCLVLGSRLRPFDVPF